MADRDFDDQLKAFLDGLRTESDCSPGHGIGRFARTVRGAVGIAAGVVRSRRRGEAGLTAGDLKSVEKLVERLGELKGLPMKAGQILGYMEADLPEEMRRLLALLQTQSRLMPFARIEQVLSEDLGARAGPLLAGLDRTAVSAASIGQVHRARLPDGSSVAVKIRYPEIEDAIRSDFSGAAAGTAFASLMVPGAGGMAKEFVKEAKSRLLEECDYRLEASRQKLFSELYAGHPDVVVPRVFEDWCGPRVLTTAWEAGRDFDAFAGAATQPERDRVGQALFEFYVGALYRHGLFHADPHPGNYRVRDDGRIVVYDYGCVRVFEPESLRAFVALAQAVREDDERRIREALAGLGAEPPRDPKTFAHVRGLLRGFFGPMLETGAHRMDSRIELDTRQIARDKMAMAKLRLPGKLLFLFRIRFGLYSVLARLGAVCDWGALERRFAEEVRG